MASDVGSAANDHGSLIGQEKRIHALEQRDNSDVRFASVKNDVG